MEGAMVRSCCAGLVVAALALTASCDSNPAEPSSSSGNEQLALKLSTAHFRVLADRAIPTTLQAIADALEAAYPRVTADLRTGELAAISAHVWTDEASFNAAMRSNLGVVWQGTRGYVFAPNNVAVLAVASAGAIAQTATHEFIHVATLAVNPSISNNPRWLWETVALYENREFVHPATLAYMRAGQLPTLAALNASFNDSRQIYEVGCVLGEFIVANWGLDGMVRLVKTNGNLPDTLGLSVAEFETRWYAFLKAQYGVPSILSTVAGSDGSGDVVQVVR
jgi:hypothetical protein